MKRVFLIITVLLSAVVVSCTDFQEEEIPVSFGVNTTELSFSAGGDSRSVTVSSGLKWDVTSMPGWISLGRISRSESSPYEWTVDFSSSANDEYNREGVIVFKAKSDTKEITVTQEGKKGKYIAVESVSVSPIELTLTVGDDASLSFVITPSNASVKDVSWKSSNTSVATVSQTGQVSAVAEGTTTITVTTEDGGKTASCTVTVNPASVSSVSLDKESLTLKVGESSTLTATIQPENAANKKITWSSSNTSIATVDSNGRVTAIGIGSAIISVTTEDGGKKAECQVLVKEPTRATSIAFIGTDFLYSARVGNQFTISVDIKPEDAYVELEWSVSDDALAEISGEGRSITLHAKDYGPSILRVRDKISGLSVSEEMNAGLTDFYWTENTGITYNGCPLVEIEVGEKRQLNCYYNPEYATRVFRSDMKGFRYYEPIGDNTEVSNIPMDQPSFFSIDENGTITGKKVGLTRIQVYSPIILNNAQDLYVRVIKTIHVPDAVDMGLSVKWASFNLGASRPEEYGDYYAWGDTEPYYEAGYAQSDSPVWKSGKETGYGWSSYIWGVGTDDSMTKYCTESEYGYNGFIDNKTVLESEDDAAKIHLGGKWRMPTREELNELLNNCTWEKTKQNGIGGYRVIGPTGNSIFLPFAGGRFNLNINSGEAVECWSSSIDNEKPNMVYGLFCDSTFGPNWTLWARCSGFPIRPVHDSSTSISVIGVSLDKTSLTMGRGDTYTLIATVSPSNATNKTVMWSSSNTSVATVSSSGMITAKSEGTALITVITNDGGKIASCLLTVYDITPSLPVPEAIDMGLSVKWASFNVGASKPEEYGNYYAWGETETKSNYSWSTYKFGSSQSGPFSKYNTNDNKVVLEAGPNGDDVACKKLGGRWRMPTQDEWMDLYRCTWTWTTQNGVNGYKVTAANGNSIFLPAAGYRENTDVVLAGSTADFWSSSRDTENNRSYYGKYMGFNSSYVLPGVSYRYYGFSVRPVSEY